ncbi:hypothetical protein EUX98_g2950 [Antrodiella citrinella]|uniref:Protein kinase domain-containing protein n=1 Tax=Antrodiella citrinella TaxID=2447956 RepID=A0A4S4MZ34_9APHY|nr:hypothetical protein EUX98_g2950 [Antrodiella citrinella]
MIPPPPPQEATDIFSISDQVLADRLQFIEEIGFGNWGSVWLCRPKPDPPSTSGAPPRPNDNKIAVKLVHRSKTSTTAARVRSLWNEMKVVRSFKHEPHPSIIPFYSFIITPSYALITMAYHPRLVPVEVNERHAKEWFHSLLSGVEFLHKRGVVHNDIKPANILLSSENVPVFVDFGFAERYDTTLDTAFHSNLSYGTPEYLSPERARGMPHDTRKSDVWSLGITFFEILVGRTPFEYSEGEQFSTKEDLEKYWSRTLKGKWVGSWKMSAGIEALLRRMILPNADLRCTASAAMGDAYWTMEVEKEKEGRTHRKAASIAHPASPSIDALNASEVSKLINVTSPWSPPSNTSLSTTRTNSTRDKKEKKPTKSVAADKENLGSPPGLSPSSKDKHTSKRLTESKHARSYSQPKLQLTEGKPRPRTNDTPGTPRMSSIFSALSPIPQIHIAPTPLNTPDATAASVNVFANPNAVFSSPRANGSSGSVRAKKPLGPRKRQESGSPMGSLRLKKHMAADVDAPPPVPEKDDSPVVLRAKDAAAKDKEAKDARRRSRVFGVDLTGLSRNANSNGGDENKKPVLVPSHVTKKKVAPAVKDKENSSAPTSHRTVAATSTKSSSAKQASRPLANAPTKSRVTPTSPISPGDSVRDRMREWEKERQRLRELSRFESETERESEAERAEARVARVEKERKELVEEQKRRRVQDMMREMEEQREREVKAQLERDREEQEREERERVQLDEREQRDKDREACNSERRRFNLPQIAVVDEPEVESALPTPLSPLMEESFESRFLDEYTRSGNESSLNLLKQSLKMSIADGAVRLYKSSTALALGPLGRSTNSNDLHLPVRDDDEESRRSVSNRASWENDALIREVRNEQLAQESQLDRMTIWIRSVEKVVEDARHNFNASTTVGPLPPLPVAPIARHKSLKDNQDTSADLSRSQRSNRVPRRILAANQIFVNEYETGTPAPSPLASSFECGSLQPPSSSFAMENNTLPTIPSEDERSRVEPTLAPVNASPNRARRATVVTRSPEPKVKVKHERRMSLEVNFSSPTKRREKSRSQNDLGRCITPVTQLEFEVEKLSKPSPPASQRLSAVVDKNLFIQPTTPTHITDFEDSVIMKRSLRYDDLTSSPLHVNPYPARPQSQLIPVMDTPAKKHVESVYDRFLMSTTGVKRNGRGYQSDNIGPIGHVAPPQPKTSKHFFTATRKMPPPVSSEDWRGQDTSADEFGTLGGATSPGPKAAYGTFSGKTDGVSKFRTALRTIVNGKR